MKKKKKSLASSIKFICFFGVIFRENKNLIIFYCAGDDFLDTFSVNWGWKMPADMVYWIQRVNGGVPDGRRSFVEHQQGRERAGGVPQPENV